MGRSLVMGTHEESGKFFFELWLANYLAEFKKRGYFKKKVLRFKADDYELEHIRYLASDTKLDSMFDYLYFLAVSS